MKTSEAQKRATANYQKTLASISIRIKHEKAAKYKTAAKDAGMSLREFIITAMDEKLERMN